MANRINSLGGVHFEKGRGYRASVSVNGNRIRSQRVKSKKTATVILNRIRRALGGNLNIGSPEMTKLYLEGTVSITDNG